MDLRIPPQPDLLAQIAFRKRTLFRRILRIPTRTPRLFAAFVLLIFGLLVLYRLLVHEPKGETAFRSAPSSAEWSREELPLLLRDHWSRVVRGSIVSFSDRKGNTFYLSTTLNRKLQAEIKKQLHAAGALAVCVAAVNPRNGHIVALVEEGRNARTIPLAAQSFPAASLFKIVTAAAALDTGTLTPNTRIPYNGGKYTLYKRNLKNRRTKYTRYVSFRRAFAESINTVFGKVGLHRLGADTLLTYARRLGFDSAPSCDLPLASSRIFKPESDFQVAELACGYNKRTRITPLHAAALALLVDGDGVLYPLRLVKTVWEPSGKVRYAVPVEEQPRRILSVKTARLLRQMMQATLLKGTCARAFRKIRPLLRKGKVEAGGKTGTIDNAAHTRKYDWFSGYVRDRRTGRDLCLVVLVIHGKRLGVRASRLAATLISRFLKSRIPVEPSASPSRIPLRATRRFPPAPTS